MVNTQRRPDLGRVSGSLCEALAWLTSPAAIAGEISALERAQAGGDASQATRVLLRDWQAVQRAQATLVQRGDERAAACGLKARLRTLACLDTGVRTG